VPTVSELIDPFFAWKLRTEPPLRRKLADQREPGEAADDLLQWARVHGRYRQDFICVQPAVETRLIGRAGVCEPSG
jgi:hypothetical protein